MKSVAYGFPWFSCQRHSRRAGCPWGPEDGSAGGEPLGRPERTVRRRHDDPLVLQPLRLVHGERDDVTALLGVGLVLGAVGGHLQPEPGQQPFEAERPVLELGVQQREQVVEAAPVPAPLGVVVLHRQGARLGREHPSALDDPLQERGGRQQGSQEPDSATKRLEVFTQEAASVRDMGEPGLPGRGRSEFAAPVNFLDTCRSLAVEQPCRPARLAQLEQRGGVVGIGHRLEQDPQLANGGRRPEAAADT